MKANCAPEALAASSVTPRRAGGQAMIAGSSAARVSPQPDAEACGVEIDHGDRSGLGGLHCPTPPFWAMIAIVCMSSPHLVEASTPRRVEPSRCRHAKLYEK
jgi:hypothetical protein